MAALDRSIGHAVKPYKPMTIHPEFWAWVSDTVQALSGIKPQHLCGPAWEPVLTYAENRTSACQVVCEEKSQDNYQALARPSESASTHIESLDRKRP